MSVIEIEQNTNYDLDMEILSSLPRFPKSANIEDLCKDFGKNRPTMKAMLDGLKHTGVQTYDTAMGTCAYVRSDAWPRVRQITRAYWDMVYGE